METKVSGERQTGQQMAVRIYTGREHSQFGVASEQKSVMRERRKDHESMILFSVQLARVDLDK